jgi:hypothetical protein
VAIADREEDSLTIVTSLGFAPIGTDNYVMGYHIRIQDNDFRAMSLLCQTNSRVEPLENVLLGMHLC